MSGHDASEMLYKGKFLHLIRRKGWEYVERPNGGGAVFIMAVTADEKVLLTHEYRVPVEAEVIGMPAGLVGDLGSEETLETAVRRELVEETGYEAETVDLLTKGPTSPGLCDEVIAVMLATGLRRIGAGG